MQKIYIELILKRLEEEKLALKQQFFQSHPIDISRHFVLDNLLPIDLALEIYANFPEVKKMKNLSRFGKLKLKYKHLNESSPVLRDINAAIQDPTVVQKISEITEIKGQVPDRSRFAGGISVLLKGYYLNPHIDISHNAQYKDYYRTANVLYYVSPDWKVENGGNYEIWDREVKQYITIPALFNRLVVMETGSSSWHAVSKVECDNPRCCIFNYYFSKQSPEGKEFFKKNRFF